MISKKHIRQLPTRNGGYIDATVAKMEKKWADYWHFEYQPTIDGLRRADSGWNWPNFHYWFEPVARLLGQAPFSYCLGVEGNMGNFVPVGMLMLAGRYPALDNHNQSAVFTWFVSTAPEELIADRVAGRDIPRGLGQALIDVALTHSDIVGHDGRMGLHAAQKGGDGLVNFYQNRVQLLNLSKSAKLPRGRKLTGNDGRYFYANKECAFRIRERQQQNR